MHKRELLELLTALAGWHLRVNTCTDDQSTTWLQAEFNTLGGALRALYPTHYPDVESTKTGLVVEFDKKWIETVMRKHGPDTCVRIMKQHLWQGSIEGHLRRNLALGADLYAPEA
jgi:hypothetical protein